MRLFGAGILFIASAAILFAQRGTTYGSLGGMGNVVYPGTGHAPNTANTGNAMLPGRAGSRGMGYYSRTAPRFNHPAGHGRGVIVPYPVIVGGYGGYYGAPAPYYNGYGPDPYAGAPPPDAGQIDPNAPPSVLMNPNFVPDRAYPAVRDYGPDSGAPPDSTMKLYQTPPTHPYADQQAQARGSGRDDQPTIYLLAFKDHNIVPALGYWMEGGTLHYVSVEHTMNQASIDLIDPDLSQRLNDERGVEFKLPKQQ